MHCPNTFSVHTIKLASDIDYRTLEVLNEQGTTDPYAKLHELFIKLAARIAAKDEDLLQKLYAVPLEKCSITRDAYIDQIQREFTKEKADKVLREFCANLSNGCEAQIWDSNVWFCGLEWGGGWLDSETGLPYINLDNFRYPSDSNVIGDTSIEGITNWLNAYRFNQYLCRFFCYFYDWPVADQNAISYAKSAAQHGLFRTVAAKLNLYPFSRRSHKEWMNLHVRYKGVDLGSIATLKGKFPDQNEYTALAIETRKFSFQRHLAETSKTKPVIIICVGLGNSSQFAEAFGADTTEKLSLPYSEISSIVYPIREVWSTTNTRQKLTSNNCWLIVLPFFYGGPASLASHDKLKKTAFAIKNFLAENGITKFW